MKKSFKNSIVIISSLAFMSFMLFAFTPSYQKPWNIPAEYNVKKNNVKADPTTLKAGEATFGKYCKACHGAKGLGNTKVPSFATPAFKKQVAGIVYYKAIIGNKQGGMPNFEQKITNETDRWSLVNYLYTL